MSLRTLASASARALRLSAVLPHAHGRRPAAYLTLAAAGAITVNLLTGAGTDPAESATLESASVAEQLGITADVSAAGTGEEAVRPLEQLVASRSERDAAATAARAAAEEAARVEAARVAEAEAAVARPGQGTSAAVAPAGSYQDYAMGKLGGSGSEFTCLENLWGKESGWNPNAQNPSSTAYGIAQFLDSTWAGTGIAKTSDGYRQIDAGLIYIEKRFGSPCGAWSHSQSTGWY
jgi:hypothetical protein